MLVALFILLFFIAVVLGPVIGNSINHIGDPPKSKKTHDWREDVDISDKIVTREHKNPKDHK